MDRMGAEADEGELTANGECRMSNDSLTRDRDASSD